MYEAAQIEGCTAWESFWKITLPMISSLILVNVIYTIVDFCTKSDSQLMTLISDTLYAKFDYGLTTAMSWVYFAIIMVILGILSFIISRWVYYYD
jgi:ABC-type sugar transport system permease subunit